MKKIQLGSNFLRYVIKLVLYVAVLYSLLHIVSLSPGISERIASSRPLLLVFFVGLVFSSEFISNRICTRFFEVNHAQTRGMRSSPVRRFLNLQFIIGFLRYRLLTLIFVSPLLVVTGLCAIDSHGVISECFAMWGDLMGKFSPYSHIYITLLWIWVIPLINNFKYETRFMWFEHRLWFKRRFKEF